MDNDEFKVLQMAEKLLADLQHNTLNIPQYRRAQIREYFSCAERGAVICRHRAEEDCYQSREEERNQ